MKRRKKIQKKSVLMCTIADKHLNVHCTGLAPAPAQAHAHAHAPAHALAHAHSTLFHKYSQNVHNHKNCGKAS